MQNYTDEMEKAAAAVVSKLLGTFGRSADKFAKLLMPTQDLVQAARKVKIPSANPALSEFRPQSFGRKLRPWGIIAGGAGLGLAAKKSGITDYLQNSITEYINR